MLSKERINELEAALTGGPDVVSDNTECMKLLALARWAITSAKPALEDYKHLSLQKGTSHHSSAAEALAKFPQPEREGEL